MNTPVLDPLCNSKASQENCFAAIGQRNCESRRVIPGKSLTSAQPVMPTWPTEGPRSFLPSLLPSSPQCIAAGRVDGRDEGEGRKMAAWLTRGEFCRVRAQCRKANIDLRISKDRAVRHRRPFDGTRYSCTATSSPPCACRIAINFLATPSSAATAGLSGATCLRGFPSSHACIRRGSSGTVPRTGAPNS